MATPERPGPRAEAGSGEVQRLRLLAEAGALFGASLDRRTVLERLCSFMVAHLGDWASVDVMDEAGVPTRLIVTHADPAKQHLVDRLMDYGPAVDMRNPSAEVWRSGRAKLLAEITDEAVREMARDEDHLSVMRALGLRSGIAAPLVARGRLVGMLGLARCGDSPLYTERDLVLVQELAHRAAMAVDNAGLFGELERAEARYRTLVEGFDAMVWEGDAHMTIRFVSEPAERFLGYGKDRWLTDPGLWQDVIHPADRNFVTTLRRRAIEAGVEHECEYRVVRSDGKRAWVREFVSVDLDGGSPASTRGLMIDVTTRRTGEEHAAVQLEVARVLAETRSLEQLPEAVLRAMLTGLGWDLAALWTIETSQAVLRCSEIVVGPACEAGRFVQRSRAESFERGIGLPGRVWEAEEPVWIVDVTQDPNFPRAPDAAAVGLRTGIGFPIMAAGRVVAVVELHSTEPRERDDALLELLAGIGTQIGQLIERRRFELALAESESRMRSVVDSALDAVVSMDADGLVVGWNAAAERIFGYERGEAIGRRLDELILPPSARADHRAALERYVRTGEALNLGERRELRVLRADGTEFPAELTITKVEGIWPPSFTGFIRDLSDKEAIDARRRVQLDVTGALADSTTVREAMGRILEAIGTHLGWDLGTLWLTDTRQDHLSCAALWHVDGLDVSAFEEASRATTFRRGDWLPGSIWARREPIWVQDVRDQASYPRVAAAGHAGLTSAFGVPIVAGEMFLGVLEFFGRQQSPPDEDLVRTMHALGQQIGGFVERTRAREELRFQKTLLELQSDTAMEGIIVLGPDGRILSRNRRYLEMFDISPELVRAADDERILQAALARLEDPDAALAELERLTHRPEEESRAEVALRDGRILERYTTPVLDAEGTVHGRVWYFRDVTERKRTERILRETGERAAFLEEASTVLMRTLDVRSILDDIVRHVVPVLGDACVIDLVEPDGSIGRAAAYHPDPDKRAALAGGSLRDRPGGRTNPSRGPAGVIATGRAELVSSLDPEQGWSGGIVPRGYLSVPLSARGRIIGAMTFVSERSDPAYGRSILSLAEDLAWRVAIAIENAQLYAERTHVAQTLRQSLLPPSLPALPDLEVGARFHPASEVAEIGGDFYDLFETARDDWAIVIGDVCGKGAEAAAMTALARYTMRAAAMSARRPSRVLAHLNEAILLQQEAERFCTVLYARVRRSKNGNIRFTVGVGGHPLPFILRRDGRVETIGEPGTLIGLFESIEISDKSTFLEPGDAVVMYTDGVSEARGPAGMLGEERLGSIIAECRGLDAGSIAGTIADAALTWQEGRPRDDVAIVVLRVPTLGEASVSHDSGRAP